MAKKKRQPTQQSAIKRDLRTPKYQSRVVESAVAYQRRQKHLKKGLESFAKLVA